jgi:uncharacterized protein (TIGR03083 family)
MTMGPDDVDLAAAAVTTALRPVVGHDWRLPAGLLDWSCRDTAVHVAHDLTAYAGQVAARPADAYLPFDLTVPDAATPAQILDVLTAAARLLRSVLAAAGPHERAWHWGPTDPSGFAALGVNEMLVHTWDITQGLGIDWRPPGPLSAGVLRRLFPDAPAGDPAGALLWCTGRIALDGRERRTSWVLTAAVS